MASSLKTLFADIADAIHTKTGNTNKIAPIDFPAQINNIKTTSGESEGCQWCYLIKSLLIFSKLKTIIVLLYNYINKTRRSYNELD